MKLVPGDWGPNFGTEWHQNEAVYWGCRLGVSPQLVASWQKAADEAGMAEEISVAKVRGRELIIFEEVDGSARCSDVKVLARVKQDWNLAWRLPIARDSMDYCTGACPAVRVKMSGQVLTIEDPKSTDPNEDTTFTCKHVAWRKQNFRWTGDTFALESH